MMMRTRSSCSEWNIGRHSTLFNISHSQSLEWDSEESQVWRGRIIELASERRYDLIVSTERSSILDENETESGQDQRLNLVMNG